jgi:hypothetical protein
LWWAADVARPDVARRVLRDRGTRTCECNEDHRCDFPEIHDLLLLATLLRRNKIVTGKGAGQNQAITPFCQTGVL